jgi:site-specific DNA-methyltransferase (adenine-specific)
MSGRDLSALYSSHRQTWRTPTSLYAELDREFGFTLDPCPFAPGAGHGLLESWIGERVFCNPPYSACYAWVEKCWTEAGHAQVVVALLPARTDTPWWHEYALRADEIRFIRGRLSYDDSGQRAPFPSVIVVWRGAVDE